jgi:hypothetical protein
MGRVARGIPRPRPGRASLLEEAKKLQGQFIRKFIVAPGIQEIHSGNCVNCVCSMPGWWPWPRARAPAPRDNRSDTEGSFELTVEDNRAGE